MVNNCPICGSPSFKEETVQGYVVTKEGRSVDSEIPVGVCDTCGLMKQINLPFSNEEEYREYYEKNYPPGSSEYRANYSHKLHYSEKMFKMMGLAKTKRLLDVGCGYGALVDVCRKNGIEAFGCDIVKYYHAPENPHIYHRKFEEISFPTDYFDKVVCLDVIEHVLDPFNFLREVFRVTAQEGLCYFEFPLFYHKDGKAHWKLVEHVWYFKPEQFETLLRRVGFIVDKTIEKEPTKIIFVCRKPAQKRVTLLLPPGVGDVYWPLVKTQSLLRAEGITPPVDAVIASPREKKYNGHKRAFPFLQMFPFLHASGEARFNPKEDFWREAYLQQGNSIFRNVLGCDYFITWNGYLIAGKTLEEVDPDLECNWHLPRFISLREERYREDSIAQYGDYMLLYWVFLGTNSLILKHFTPEQIAEAVFKVVRQTGLRPILIGAAWDLHDDQNLDRLSKLLPKDTVDLRGKTNIEDVFGLIRGAKLVLGMNSGITIMSAAFGVKTIQVIHEYLTTGRTCRAFAWNTVPPDVRRKTYWAEYAEDITVDGMVARAVSVVKDKKYVEKPNYLRSHGGENVDWKDMRTKRGRQVKYPSIKEMVKEPVSTELDIVKAPVSADTVITIACVLKSGGEFNEQYVINMKNMLERNLTRPFNFVCLTDLPKIDGCQTVRQTVNLHGWWAKIELFRPKLFNTDRIVYFDLDTLIVSNIDDIFELNGDFYGLRPWNRANRQKGQCASGMMAWHNGFGEFIWSGFNKSLINRFQGDQHYLSQALKKHNVSYRPLQDYIPGIYSFKRECRQGLPNDARVVCFHGRPRIHEVKASWVRRAWASQG